MLFYIHQVSKVEDKYNSIYSGMLKGNKKKLMKYIDPKFNRPNPDAMAMGRAINLVKKDSDKEEVNENKYRVGYEDEDDNRHYIEIKASSEEEAEQKSSGLDGFRTLKSIELVNEAFDGVYTDEGYVSYDSIAQSEFGMDYDQLGPNEKEWVRDEIGNLDESINEAKKIVTGKHHQKLH